LGNPRLNATREGDVRNRPELPIETDPFLVQIVAVGVGQDLRAAIETAVGGLRKRATLLRTKLGFPMIHGCLSP